MRGTGGCLGRRRLDILAPRSLIAIANHFRGTQVLSRPAAGIHASARDLPDLADIKGQETAKRALEVAAAAATISWMIGLPRPGQVDAGAALPSILPPLAPKELLEVSMIASVAGELAEGRPDRSAAVPRPAPLRLDGGDGRRRPARAAGRSVAGPSRRAVSRRISRILATDARRAAPAARDRRLHDRPRQFPCHLPGAHTAGGGDESVPLRHGGGARLPLPARRPLPHRLPGAHLDRCSTASISG